MDSAIHGICGIRLDGERLDVPEFHDDVVNHYGRFDEEFLVVGIHLPVRMLL